MKRGMSIYKPSYIAIGLATFTSKPYVIIPYRYMLRLTPFIGLGYVKFGEGW